MAGITAINFVLLAVLGGLVFVRLFRQHQRDRSNHVYLLTFPADLNSDQVVEWVSSISGTLRGRYHGLTGVPTVVLETWATSLGYIYRLRVPWQYEHHIIDALTTMIPGATATEDKEKREHNWSTAVEVGESNPDRALRILSPEQMARSILASMKRLGDDEEVITQLVIAGAKVREHVEPPKPPKGSGVFKFVTFPKAGDDTKAKLAQTNYQAVLRVGAKATTRKGAQNLINKVRGALTSANGPNNRFTLTGTPSSSVASRIALGQAMSFWPARLSADELVALMAWPMGSPNIPGLPQSRTRYLAPSPSVAREGIVLGTANAPGFHRPVAISTLGSTMHTWLSGSTGTGKSTAMANIFAQVVGDGSGAMIIETKGEDNDLFHKALDYIPSHRLEDVIIMDVTDTEYPVGFNILSQGNPQAIAANLENLIEQIYGSFGVRMPAALYHGLMVFMTSVHVERPLTIADLPILYAPMSREEVAFADHLIRGVPDDEIRRWWQLVENQYPSLDKRNNFFEPVNQRLWQINGRPELRNIFGQSVSSFDMKQAVRDKKIILVNLPGLGRPVQNLLGATIIDRLWGAVQSGASSPHQPFYLLVDEFQNYPNLATDANEMLAEARARGLAMVLANQGLQQLTPKSASGLMNNARNKIVLNTSSSNASALARELSTTGTKVSEQDLTSLGPYEAICRFVGDRGLSEAVTVDLSPPLKTDGLAREVRTTSRRLNGRPRAEVEREIKERRAYVKATTKRRPTIGTITEG